MAWQLDVTVDGPRIVLAVRSAGLRRELLNLIVLHDLGPKGKRIMAVGEAVPKSGPGRASPPDQLDVVPFGDGAIDVDCAIAFLRFESIVLRSAVYPGWRNVHRGGRPIVALRYAAWPRLPRTQRQTFIRECARHLGCSELRVNSHSAVRRTRVRALFGLGPVVDLDA